MGKDNTEEGSSDDLDFKRTIRIAVTGDVHLTAAEAAVVDARDFQRLRGVRQLGTVNLLYPTALHTRFDHSLGTLAMADKMVRALAKNMTGADGPPISLEQRKLARMYALLHDIAHVPFGHTFEDEYQLHDRHDRNGARIAHFLGPDSEIGLILRGMESGRFYERLMLIGLWSNDDARVLGGSREDETFIHDLVSEGVCADLLDYLERDSYFCNIGNRLEHRYLDDLRLGSSNADDEYGSRPATRRLFLQMGEGNGDHVKESLGDLLKLLKATLTIAEMALFHPVKLATCAMLFRAYQECHATQRGDAWLYYESDDTVLKELCAWEEESGRNVVDCGSAVGLATLLKYRRLHQLLAVYDEARFATVLGSCGEEDIKGVVEQLRQPEYRRDLENHLAGTIRCRPGNVLLYVPSLTMTMKGGRMNVRWRGEDLTLREVEDRMTARECGLSTSQYKRLWAVRLFVGLEIDEAQGRLLKREFEQCVATLGD